MRAATTLVTVIRTEDSTHWSLPNASKMRTVVCSSLLSLASVSSSAMSSEYWKRSMPRDSVPSISWTSGTTVSAKRKKPLVKLTSDRVCSSNSVSRTSRPRRDKDWISQSCSSLWCSTRSSIKWKWEESEAQPRGKSEVRGRVSTAQNESDHLQSRNSDFKPHKPNTMHSNSKTWAEKTHMSTKSSASSKQHRCKKQSSKVSATLRVSWSTNLPIRHRNCKCSRTQTSKMSLTFLTATGASLGVESEAQVSSDATTNLKTCTQSTLRRMD